MIEKLTGQQDKGYEVGLVGLVRPVTQPDMEAQRSMERCLLGTQENPGASG